MSHAPVRRQRAERPAFSSVAVGVPALGRSALTPKRKSASTPLIIAPARSKMVAAQPTVKSPSRQSRFLHPVPPPKPDEILPRKRGRNGLKRVHQAEHFRQYMYLRRQLKPWSDAFRLKHGRTPSLVDVHQANVPGLLDRFVEYLEALNQLRR